MFRIKFLLSLTLLSLFIVTSCTMEKRLHRPGYHVEWKSGKNDRPTQQPQTAPELTAKKNRKSEAKADEQIPETTMPDQKVKNTEIPATTSASASEDIQVESQTLLQKASAADKENKRIASDFKTEFKSGYALITQEVASRKVHGLSIAGFIAGLVGLFIFGIILGIIAIIFSAIGLGKSTKEPELWSGKGFAIAGLILGIIDVVAMLIIIAMIA